MQIHAVKALGDIPQLANKSARDAARSTFLQRVKMPGTVVTDPCVEDQHPGDIDDGLYIGAHECERNHEDVYVELWAFSDEPETDWLGWELFAYGHRIPMPLQCCPFCGVDLYELIKPND